MPLPKPFSVENKYSSLLKEFPSIQHHPVFPLLSRLPTSSTQQSNIPPIHQQGVLGVSWSYISAINPLGVAAAKYANNSTVTAPVNATIHVPERSAAGSSSLLNATAGDNSLFVEIVHELLEMARSATRRIQIGRADNDRASPPDAPALFYPYYIRWTIANKGCSHHPRQDSFERADSVQRGLNTQQHQEGV
uniref:Uncharacterized protein n=1 Tax=Glossina pallidipes TaxID=7398 RepID=A0A1A9ZJV1_GLOPL